FILGIRTIRTNEEYSQSSLMNYIRLLSVYCKASLWNHEVQFKNATRICATHEKVSIDTSQGLLYGIFMCCCLLFQSHGGEHYKILIKQITFTSNGKLVQDPWFYD
ncbi:34221_t:CDS:2, partial [Racocetra persica]